MSYSVDIAAVTEELASHAQAKRSLVFEVEPFVPRSDATNYGWKGSLEQLIHKQIGDNAKWLRSMDDTIRAHLAQYGSILGMVKDIQLQNKITRLSYAMVTLTVALAILTFFAVMGYFD